MPSRSISRLALALLTTFAAAATTLDAQRRDMPREGRWTLDVDERENQAYLQLTMRWDDGRSNWNTGSRVPIDRIRGLTREQMQNAAGNAVRFEIPREAGTLRLEGWMRGGLGSGHFTWAANPAFATELDRRGIGRPDDADLFELTMHDVGIALIDELRRQNYPRPTLRQLVQLGRHGVNMSYVTGMDRLGIRAADLEELRRLRDHGVTPTFVREMRAAGYTNLSADELRMARDHGVTPEVIAEFAELGFRNLDIDEARMLVDHGVRPDYIRAMRSAGFANLSARELRRAKDHGVTASFARRARERRADVTIDEVIRMRDRGWEP